LQLSAIPVPVTYVPVQPVAPVASVKGRDAESEDAVQKLRAAPPSGAGSLLDIEA
jgi:hypothetical protein